MQYVPRLDDATLSDYLSDDSADKPVFLITGPPQVGKTRLVEHALETAKQKRVSFSLKHHPHFLEQVEACTTFKKFRKLLEEDSSFDPTKKLILFIDDIQESSVLASYIPRLTDTWRGSSIILCGTFLPEAYDTYFHADNDMVRHLSLQPFQFSEFLKANQKGSLSRLAESGKTAIFEERHTRLLEWLERFLEVGGLPEVVDWASHGEDFSFHLDEIIMDFNKRLEDRLGKAVQLAAEDALRLVSRDPGALKIEGICSDLQRWELLFQLTSESNDVEKCYVFDTGILHHYQQVEPPNFWDVEQGDPDATELLSTVMTNQVALSLKRQTQVAIEEPPSSVDFMVALADTSLLPIMCKPVFDVTDELKGEALALMGSMNATCGVVVTLAPYDDIEAGGTRIHLMPLYLVESLIAIASRPQVSTREA